MLSAYISGVFQRAASTMRLIGRALSDPVSVSWQAWILAMPLVIADAFAAEFLISAEPSLDMALIYVPAAFLGYAIALGWLALARWVLLRLASQHDEVRVLTSTLAWALVGATWMTAAILSGEVVAAAESPFEIMGAQNSIAAAALVSVTFGAFIGVFLHARSQANRARAWLADEQARSADIKESMNTIQVAARQSLTAWLDDVLEPALALLVQGLNLRVPDIVQRIDGVRERVVRVASRRLHPRTIALGPRVALQSVAQGHGYRSEITISGVGDLPDVVTTCLARCLDAFLTSYRARDVHVELTWSDHTAVMRITGSSPSAAAAAPELLARVRYLHGTAEVAGDGVVITLPLDAQPLPPEVVAAAEFNVAALAAVGLGILTTVVMALLGAGAGSLLLGVICALVVALLLSVVRQLRAWFITLVALVSSAVVTGAWEYLVSAGVGDVGAVIFWLANALVIALVIALLESARRQIRHWESEVGHAWELAEQSALTAQGAIRDIDSFREQVASTLHSHIQARLVAAAGRLEQHSASGIAGASQALMQILDEDIPRLRALCQEHPATGEQTINRTLRDVLASFNDLALTLTIDPDSPAMYHREVITVINEALVNAVRHGGATRVSVDITPDANDWLVCVTDNGIGLKDCGDKDFGLKDSGLNDSGPSEVGLGALLMESASGGRWSLEAHRDGGAVLTARVAL